MMMLVPAVSLANFLARCVVFSNVSSGFTVAEAEKKAWEEIFPHLPYPTEFTQLVVFAGPPPAGIAVPEPPPGPYSE